MPILVVPAGDGFLIVPVGRLKEIEEIDDYKSFENAGNLDELLILVNRWFCPDCEDESDDGEIDGEE